ncbi:MAG: thrombospondin type 3 repeat-containing protein [Bacteroidales bacterium]|nr:thrombospondin type 3 repeat-containing protein [Bacteroidales bacterium]
MKRKDIFVILFLLPFVAFSQTDKDAPSTTFDKILQLDKSPISSDLKLPILTLGAGVVSFHGDVMNDEPANFAVGCMGINFEMTQKLRPALFVGIRYLHSELRGSTYLPEIQTFFNFKTEINSFGAFLKYDFSNIKAIYNRSTILSPYISAGISVLQRPEARGDWSSNGEKLYLWSDGSFRNIAESNYNASKASVVYRDYDYETSLQVVNSNDKDYYSPIIATIPIELGLTYNISKVFKLNLGYQYHISATNTMDDITHAGKTEARKGSRLPDGYSYAYVSLSTDLGQIQKKSKFEAVDNENYFIEWDFDEDGIDETEDECPYTPKGVDVFANGCPLDDDKDGIPDYKDAERMTRSFFHDETGKGMTEAELRARLTQGEKLSQDELYRFYPDLLNGGTLTKQFYKRIPKKFKICDIDKNEYIDLDELLLTINSFFDEGPNAGPGASLSSKELSELIEFFFLQ